MAGSEAETHVGQRPARRDRRCGHKTGQVDRTSCNCSVPSQDEQGWWKDPLPLLGRPRETPDFSMTPSGPASRAEVRSISLSPGQI